MKTRHVFFVLLSCIFCLQVSALPRPVTSNIASLFEDSTMKAASVLPTSYIPHKRPGLFQRLKLTVAGLLLKKISGGEQGKSSSKATLGWIALGATVLGIILLFAGAGPIGGALLLIGVLMGIIALVMPRTKEEKAAGKRSNTGAIIAIVLGVGLIIAIAIALSSWK